jgi:uncharacterized protein (TIGR02284 family)
MQDNANVVSTLNNLIETLKDRDQGFQTAADAVKNADLKSLFQSYSRQSRQFSEELAREVRRLGGDPEKRGSVAGWFHRGWMNIKSAVTGGSESAIISEAERGEDSAKRNYESALKENLSTEARAIVQRQYAGIREGHDRVRALEVATSHT